MTNTLSIMVTLSRIIQCIIGLPVAVLFIWDVNGFKEWFGGLIGEDLAFWSAFVGLIVGVRALALMTTSPNAWGDRGFTHMDRVKEFRENALKGMSISDGARLLRDTAALDMPNEFGPESATGRTRRFMDAKFAGMTPARAIEWLRGNEK